MKLASGSRNLALVGGLLAAMFAASSALAGGERTSVATYRPDGWIRHHSDHYNGGKYVDPSAWKGDGIYNTTGRYQTAKRAAGGVYPYYFVFQVTIENDGPTDRFRVGATGTGNWTVKYFRGTTNITSAIVGGTYQTSSLGHGESLILKVKVWIGVDPAIVRLLTITSVGNPGQVDAVRVKAERTRCSC